MSYDILRDGKVRVLHTTQYSLTNSYTSNIKFVAFGMRKITVQQQAIVTHKAEKKNYKPTETETAAS